MKKTDYADKRSMNLFYKPDRTTKPATVFLYVLFVLVCLLGLGKILVFDVWYETNLARQELAQAQARQDKVMLQLADYREVKERYNRYAATEEERALIDRMKVLSLLEENAGTTAAMSSISISGDTVQLQLSGVSLSEVAQIVKRLEASPIVKGIVVSTAATTGEGVEPAEDGSGLVQADMQILLQKEVAEE